MANILLSPQAQLTFRPSFCDVQLAFGSLPAPCALTAPNPTLALADCKYLAYGDSQDLKFLTGSSDTPLARVGRVTLASGEIEFGLETYTAIVRTLSNLTESLNVFGASGGVLLGGFGDFPFDLTVTYQIQPGTAVVQDILYQCRIKSSSRAMQVGGRSISARMSLSIARILYGVAGDDYGAMTDETSLSIIEGV